MLLLAGVPAGSANDWVSPESISCRDADEDAGTAATTYSPVPGVGTSFATPSTSSLTCAPVPLLMSPTS